MNEELKARIRSAGQKRVLACDGGGIRGLISVEILIALEASLRRKLKKPKLVLADYFDFVCGTSTGAIIAACISAGMEMKAIREFYVGSGQQMFEKTSIANRIKLMEKYKDEPLAKTLRAALDAALGHVPTKDEPHATLGSEGLRTVLMMVLRNHNTDSPWPISNNPFAKYNKRGKPDCNLNLPLWQLVRASTAAPTYFPPETITFAKDTPDEYSYIFVDGAVTTYNNPAFLAFQMLSSSSYQINWATGADRLLLVSVGTGTVTKPLEDIETSKMHTLHHAGSVPSALMNAASAGWDMACRNLGACRVGADIDGEFGAMLMPAEGSNSTAPKLFTYLRYNPNTTRQGLNLLGLKDVDVKHVQALDSISHIKDIQRVGDAYAKAHVQIGHFAGFV